LFYADPVAGDPAHETAAPASGTEAAAAAKANYTITAANAFKLHSKPGASRKVYLNFRGATVTGTIWNSSVSSFKMKPYSEDADTTTFNASEIATIAEVWAGMSEDYAPFDVDVTTEKPASFGPNVGHVLFSPRLDANGNYIYGSSVGGVAYVDVWGLSDFKYYQPALVFPEGVPGAKNMIEAGSHELGHNLGLSHDGTSSVGYYSGHGSGLVSWAPIMGVGYYVNVSQWSKGEYSGANNQEDDIAIITGKLSAARDDHGNTGPTATALSVVSGKITSKTPESDPFNPLSKVNRGVIGTRADVDVFKLSVPAAGTVSLVVTPAWRDTFRAQSLRNADLDIRATLYRANGNAIGAAVVASAPAANTNATLSARVTAGTYFLKIEGIGTGSVTGTGYSDYGSLGQYTITGTVPTGG
ncbi:zinc-dependent metalloprotease family protein, partial [Oharaeibacter diazotrophicus]